MKNKIRKYFLMHPKAWVVVSWLGWFMSLGGLACVGISAATDNFSTLIVGAALIAGYASLAIFCLPSAKDMGIDILHRKLKDRR